MDRREWVMLAHTIDFDKDRVAGRLMSEKLDGQRAIWDGGITRGLPVGQVPWANTAKDSRLLDQCYKATGLWSRYGRVIHAPDWFLDELPCFPLDGELWIGPRTYQELRSIVSRIEPDDRWFDVKYYSFDWPTYTELFQEGRVVSGTHYEKIFGPKVKQFIKDHLWGECHDLFKPSTSILTRYNKFFGWWGDRPQKTFWRIHHQEELSMSTDEAIERIHQKMNVVLSNGGEGLILRARHSTWKPKRTRDLLKIKPYSDDEATILGYTWGKKTDRGSRLMGLMGTLVVEWKGIRFELGSGFTNEERRLTVSTTHHPGEVVEDNIFNQQFPRGSTVTFKYRELSDDGVPKEATYYRRRDVSQD